MPITVTVEDEDVNRSEWQFEELPRRGDFLSLHVAGDRHHTRYEVVRVWHINMGEGPYTTLDVRKLEPDEP
jgi:hypothetical protein